MLCTETVPDYGGSCGSSVYCDTENQSTRKRGSFRSFSTASSVCGQPALWLAPCLLEALDRVPQPGGLLLLAFHTGDEVLQEKELWGRLISMDFFLFQPSAIRQCIEVAGLRIEEHGVSS